MTTVDDVLETAGGLSTDNRVTQEQITAIVADMKFTTARVGDSTITGCWSYLPNGFCVAYGQSGCVDPNNYNAEVGQRIAQKNCYEETIRKLWEFEGYILAKQS